MTFKPAWVSIESRKKIKILEKEFMEGRSWEFPYSNCEIVLFQKHEGNDYTLKTQFINWIIDNKHYEL